MTIQLNKYRFELSDGWDSEYVASLIDAMGKASKSQAKSLHNILSYCEDYIIDLKESDDLDGFFMHYCDLVDTGDNRKDLLERTQRIKYFNNHKI